MLVTLGSCQRRAAEFFPIDVPVLVLVVDPLSIGRVGKCHKAVATAPAIEKHLRPIILSSIFQPRRARTDVRSIVLRPAVDLEWASALFDMNRVKFSNGKIVDMQPSCPSIIGSKQPAVISQEHTIRVLRVDPHVVMIKMHRTCLVIVQTDDLFTDTLERLSSILRVVDSIA